MCTYVRVEQWQLRLVQKESQELVATTVKREIDDRPTVGVRVPRVDTWVGEQSTHDGQLPVLGGGQYRWWLIILLQRINSRAAKSHSNGVTAKCIANSHTSGAFARMLYRRSRNIATARWKKPSRQAMTKS